jgi:hypothetical protein
MSPFSSPFLAFLYLFRTPAYFTFVCYNSSYRIVIYVAQFGTYAVPRVEVQSFLAFRWLVTWVCVNLQGRPKNKNTSLGPVSG